MRLPIFISANFGWAEQVSTLIKSVCLHNKNVDFYLMNNDFPDEWIKGMSDNLTQINCEIYTVDINSDELKKYKLLKHIKSEAAYFRFYIADVVSQGKVLYLDADTVVTGSLLPLFNMDMEGYPVAAVRDEGMTLHIQKKRFIRFWNYV